MLNPQRWGPGGASNGRNLYSIDLEKDGRTLFEADENDEDVKRKIVTQKKPPGTFIFCLYAIELNSCSQNR